MYMASRALRDTRELIGVIANNLGYQSEASFTRALPKMQRVTPSAYCRATQAAAWTLAGDRVRARHVISWTGSFGE